MLSRFKDQIHIGITAVRLVILGAALGSVGFSAIVSTIALNPLAMIFHLAIWDLLAGRFMAAEAALAEREIEINFPGKALLKSLAGSYVRLMSEARPKIERLRAVADGKTVKGGKVLEG